MTSSTNRQNPDRASNQTEELTLQQLDAASGGALQAYLSVKGQKSGKFKGESGPNTEIASGPLSD
jgi:hypothetical protein